MPRDSLRRTQSDDSRSPSPNRTGRFRVEPSELHEPEFAKASPRAPGQISFVHRVSTTCDNCGRGFVEEVPLILDEAERPALWECAMEGALARFRCPAGHEAPDDHISSLLRDRCGQLIFVPGDAVDPEEWRAAAVELAGGLPSSVLDAGPLEVAVVSRSLLPEVLTALPAADPGHSRPLPELLADVDAARDDTELVVALERVIQQVSKDEQPLDWANLVFRLAYTRVTMGDNSARWRRALRDVIKLYDANGYPAERALAQHILGSAAWVASADFPSALDEAIDANRGAVAGLDRQTQRRAWVLSQRTLGAALLTRDNHADLEPAFDALNAALEELPSDLEEIRPEIQSDIADALFRRGEDARALELLDEVGGVVGPDPLIPWFEEELDSLDPCERPLAWGGVAWRLAAGLLTRRTRQREDDIEKAIALFEAVLQDAPGAGPEALLEAERGLAYAYRVRKPGDRGENLRRASEHSEAALARCSREGEPTVWARVQHQRGLVLREIRSGDRDLSLALAIEALEAAWSVSRRHLAPAEQLEIGNDFAMTLASRDDRKGLDRAIDVLASVAAETPRDTHPRDWAGKRGNLAGLRIWRNAHGDLATAINDLNVALSVYGVELPLPGDAPAQDIEEAYGKRDWAILQSQLGNAWSHRRDGSHQANAEEAIRAYRAALRIFKPEQFPIECRATAVNLGRVLSDQERWAEAHEALMTAIRAADQDYRSAVIDETKETTAGEVASIHSLIVDACLHLNPPRAAEALVQAEEGRSRLLRDQLSVLELPSPPGYEKDPRLARERELLDRIRELQHHQEESPPDVRRLLVDEQGNLRQELLSLWDELGDDVRTAEYVALRRGERLEFEALSRWLLSQGPGVALLEYFALEDQLVAFVARPDEAEPAAIPVRLGPEDLKRLRRQCDREVHRFDPEWPLEETWQELAAPLVEPVLSALVGVELLYVVPHGALHGVPLHAIAVDGRTLLDAAAVVYAPSATVARRLTATAPGSAPGPALVIGNPTGDLPNAETEADVVAKRFGVSPLVGPNARVEPAAVGLERAQTGHFACHAFFDPVDPFSSGLELADGVLTAHEVMRRRISGARFVLSACETGTVEVREGDELFGLSRAFLYAGAPALVVTLWAVDDPASKDIMLAFYDRWDALTNSSHPGRLAQALRGAILEARNAGAHTHFWAPYVLLGSPS